MGADMTTTLPFTPSFSKKVASVDGSLVFPETSGHRTWFSPDAVNWAPTAWPDWVIDDGYPLSYKVHFNGEMWYFGTAADSYYFDFVKSSDFLHWTHVGAFEGPSPETPINNFFTNMLLVAHGGALRAFRMKSASFVTAYSSTDGITWATHETNLPYNFYIAKIVSFGGSLYAIPKGLASYKAVYRSDDNGLTWTLLTSDWGIPDSTLIDCIATTEGLLAVFTDKETWASNDGVAWTKKAYTLPSGSDVLNNGVILPLGSDLFMVGCGTTQKNVFKLVEASGPVGIPL